MPEQREQEISRLRARVAPVQANLLTLLDARPKQPGICFGEQLASMYKATFGEALDPEKLTGQSDLKAMLNRRNIFTSIGVRGGKKTGGWLIYRICGEPSAAEAGAAGASTTYEGSLAGVEANILKVLSLAANPTTPGIRPHYSLPVINTHGRHLLSRPAACGRESV